MSSVAHRIFDGSIITNLSDAILSKIMLYVEVAELFIKCLFGTLYTKCELSSYTHVILFLDGFMFL